MAVIARVGELVLKEKVVLAGLTVARSTALDAENIELALPGCSVLLRVMVEAVIDTAAATGLSVPLSVGATPVSKRLCAPAGMDLLSVDVERLRASDPDAGATKTLAVRERVGELALKTRLADVG